MILLIIENEYIFAVVNQAIVIPDSNNTVIFKVSVLSIRRNYFIQNKKDVVFVETLVLHNVLL